FTENGAGHPASRGSALRDQGQRPTRPGAGPVFLRRSQLVGKPRQIMHPATDLTDYDAGRDPYFDAPEVGPAKPTVPGAADPKLRRRQFHTQTLMVVVAIAAVSMAVVLDTTVGPFVLMLVVWIGIG